MKFQHFLSLKKKKVSESYLQNWNRHSGNLCREHYWFKKQSIFLGWLNRSGFQNHSALFVSNLMRFHGPKAVFLPKMRATKRDLTTCSLFPSHFFFRILRRKRATKDVLSNIPCSTQIVVYPGMYGGSVNLSWYASTSISTNVSP